MPRFRVRLLNSGPPKVIRIDEEKTVADLLDLISNLFSIPVDNIVVKEAFPPPPKILNLPNHSQKLGDIRSLPSGSSLIVENGTCIPKSSAKPSALASDEKLNQTREEISQQVSKPIAQPQMTKRAIPDDNSCLFNSIAYALENRAMGVASDMRELIAGIVLSDPQTWNQAILGIENEKYVEKIMQPNTWGGSIELSIFASNYQCEIAAWDVCSKRSNIFGEGSGYKKRIYLLYDGVHYDVLAQNVDGANGAQTNDVTIFNPNDDLAFSQAASICENHFKQKKFTNVYTYKIKCNTCQSKMQGNEEVKEHADRTGHTDFVQIDDI